MQSGRDGGLVDESDFLGPEGLERIECFGDLWGSGSVGFAACNPLLVLFGVETTAFDDADADVNDVAGMDGVASRVRVGAAFEEAYCEGVKTLQWVPVRSHAESVGIAILGRRCAIFIDEPINKFGEDDVRNLEAHLFEGSADSGRE